MDVAATSNPEDVVDLARDLLAYKLYYAAASAMALYDYLLTWSDEIDYAWREKKGPGESQD
ncbi:hypothetical protein PQX77_004069 [Marasmius sp. AFHP31]|nr:hypothetical protein PQX77_004069 [Marasmius sp. AFHP31]